MDHAKKMDFVHKMTKLALEHTQQFAGGGTVTAQNQGGTNAGAIAGGGLAGVPGAIGGGAFGNAGNLNGGGLSFGDQGLAGGIADFLGTKNNFQAGAAPIVAGTTQDQLNSAYQNAQTGLNNQTGLVSTLTPQAMQATQAQAGLSDQLQQRAAGQGPNPALDQLNQATAANTANQAALMAGQRGASTNPGLIARQAAMQGAVNQQAAAGQAATQSAQQQIAAQQELSNLSNNQLNQTGQAINNQNSGLQSEQSILQNANTAANNANVGMQSNINDTNLGASLGNQKNSQGIIGNILGGGSAAISSLFGAEGGEVNQGGFKTPGSVSTDGPHIAATPAYDTSADYSSSLSPSDKKKKKKPTGEGPVTAGGGDSLEGGARSIEDPGLMIAAEGGEVDQGNFTDAYNHSPDSPQIPSSPSYDTGAASSDGGKGGSSLSSLAPLLTMFAAEGGEIPRSFVGQWLSQPVRKAKGGEVQAIVSPGERYLPPKEVKKVAEGKKSPLKAGEKIPGKPMFPGNDYRNDIVPKKLKEGGIVIPNEVLQSKNPGYETRKFVEATIAKKGLKRGLR